MTWRANKTRFPKMPVPKGRKNGSRTYIDPEAFILMRHRAFLTTQQVAKLLDVTHRTLLNWEKGQSRIPYTAFRVLKLKVGYVFDDQHFGDWFVKGNTLWSPEGRGFKPEDCAMSPTTSGWLASGSQNACPAGRKTLWMPLFRPERPATSPTSPAPACEVGTLPSCGAAPLREPSTVRETSPVRQERLPEFERFMASLGIPA